MPTQRLCSVAGCGKTSRVHGRCQAHHMRWLRHGDPTAGRTQTGDPERFIREVAVTHTGENCLPWPFSRDRHGHGLINLDGKTQRAHHIVCDEVNGHPPTQYHEAAHSCGKGHEACVSGGHLSWKTRTQNRADRHKHGTANLCGGSTQKVRPEDVRFIRTIGLAKPNRELAAMFGVTRQTIGSIKTGKTWANVT